MYHSAKQVSWKIRKIREGRSKKQFTEVLLMVPMILLVSLFLSLSIGWVKWQKDAAIDIAVEQIPMEKRSQEYSAAVEKYQEQVMVEEKEKKEISPALKAKSMGIPVVVIDPGHGGEDTGCVRESIEEKDINLTISLEVEKRLKELGYYVILTRRKDEEVSLEERVSLANENQADLYISIHQNAFEDEEIYGIETWYQKEKGEENRRLAKLLQQQIGKATGAKERFVSEESDMYGVVYTSMPACIIETGYLSNPEERSKLITTEYQHYIAEGIVCAIKYYFEPKTMYLTFDDGPYKYNTVKVLDILKKKKVKATFFLVGEYVEKNPEVAKRIAEEGHAIGVHCYCHDYHQIYGEVESYLEDFEKAHRIIKEVTGVDTKLYRFPGGSINGYNKRVREEIIRGMTERGYIYYDWNASLEDATKNPKKEQLLENAITSTLNRDKVILLAHDVIEETGECLEELLDLFPQYKMEVLTEEVKPIHF